MENKYVMIGAIGKTMIAIIDDSSAIEINTDKCFPKIEIIEKHVIDYWNEKWGRHLVQITEGIFNEQYDLVNERLNNIKEKLKK